MGIFAVDQIRTYAKVDAITKVSDATACKLLVHFLFKSGYRARLVASIVLV